MNASTFCPSCGRALARGDRFCGNCGATLGSTPTSGAPVESSAPAAAVDTSAATTPPAAPLTPGPGEEAKRDKRHAHTTRAVHGEGIGVVEALAIAMTKLR
ncbi:MAG: zinc ribbon domain-containing protein [Thermoleophilia bacterium]|nr:zinc ribbon domain-containing protein [Thermoleophilia bacterium]